MSGMNAKIRFMSKEQEQFYKKMMKKSGVDDGYHRSFFYCMGLSEVTRANIRKLYNFERGYAESDGLHGGWQTGSSQRLTRLALNLWNGYVEQGEEQMSTPYELFSCEYAPYFLEAIKLRYPEYCKELPSVRDGTDKKEQERVR